MLADNSTISEWNLEGLPSDELSVQNGLIVTKSTRFPLLVDPQSQGKVWIKNRETENQVQVRWIKNCIAIYMMVYGFLF